MSIGYVVHNKARVALERALRNPRKRVLGVEWESILTTVSPQGMGVGSVPDRNVRTQFRGSAGKSMTIDQQGLPVFLLLARALAVL